MFNVVRKKLQINELEKTSTGLNLWLFDSVKKSFLLFFLECAHATGNNSVF